jgi:hypothetical protein
MKMNAIDLSAKLLATENITVVRSRVRTACFDIKSRVLTLPQWKEMTPVVESMLIGHEVGHALYTDEKYMEPIRENNKLMSYLNVIEDVRIEKLLKRKYPGIRKSMNEGYKELNEQDFFGIAKIPDLNNLNLIDRINLYYKAGYSCGVEFNPEEKQFVLRSEKTETVEDVIALANEIYAYSKEQAEKRREEAKKNASEFDQQDDLDEMEEIEENYMDDNSDSEDSEENSNEDGSIEDLDRVGSGRNNMTEEEREELLAKKEQEELDDELESKTEKSFSEKLQDLADENTEYNYYKLDEKYSFDHMVGFKRILSETADIDHHITEDNIKSLEQFKLESNRVVNYLIKEFEMRKSATLYKRAQSSKIGSLDMKKIWSYKLNDDLFKRVMTVPQGKNHGMIFLLDWSGSMDSVLEDTVKQVINLAMFCQRAQIPYQVFAFSSQYNLLKTDEDRRKFNDIRREFSNKNNLLSNTVNEFALLEFFSSKMSNVEFNNMVRRLTNRRLRYSGSGDYNTGGTPLNEALAYMTGYIAKFSKANNIEKMSLITLTDGEGGPLHGSNNYLDDFRYVQANGTHKRINLKHFLQDPVTKKSYEIKRQSSSQTEAILRLIKDRYNINVVGFYICRNSKRDLQLAIRSNLYGFNGNVLTMIDSMRKNFRENGFTSLKNTGRDDLFIIPQNKLAVEEGVLEVDQNQTAKQIAKNFGKMLSGRKTSRVLLNKFIGYIA